MSAILYDWMTGFPVIAREARDRKMEDWKGKSQMETASCLYLITFDHLDCLPEILCGPVSEILDNVEAEKSYHALPRICHPQLHP
jgi:hypothetical protein